ncbi:MAG TPA: type II toxin-antitoxin system VapC family toxin [Gemmatimonadaceae bacterium]|jgi:predicted nucleic acid-binding protein|nr:type II toxin-antitoxin system VapC family toxin [Gemmatimonadaceae bacterium]
MRGYVLDTMVLSELNKPKADRHVIRWVEETEETLLYVSVLTLGEIRQGISAHASGARRDKLQRWLEATLRPWFAGRILAVDDDVADRWGDINGTLRARGIIIPVIDGLLAATALHHNLTFATRNIDHVAPTGVATYNPWDRGGS